MIRADPPGYSLHFLSLRALSMGRTAGRPERNAAALTHIPASTRRATVLSNERLAAAPHARSPSTPNSGMLAVGHAVFGFAPSNRRCQKC